MYDSKYIVTNCINLFTHCAFDILLNAITMLLSNFIIPIIEKILSCLLQSKKEKENVYKDVLKILSIYIMFPIIMLVVIPSEYVCTGLIIFNMGERFRYCIIIFLRVCTIFCIQYVVGFWIGKKKNINLLSRIYVNKTIFVMSIIFLLYRIICYFMWSGLNELPDEEFNFLFPGLYNLFLRGCFGITPITIYCVYCFFIKKLFVVRKKLFNYTRKDYQKIWGIISIPLFLDLYEFEFIIFSRGFYHKKTYIFTLLHLFWLLLKLLSINVVVFYIYRPTYMIEQCTFYNVTLKNGEQFIHVPFCDFIKRKDILKIKIENITYYLNEENIDKIYEEKEQKYYLSNKRRYIIKSILLWIVEICIAILVIFYRFIKETT